MGISMDCPVLGAPPIISGTGKATTSNFVGTFIGRSEQKPMKHIGNSSRGRSQGVLKIFIAPMYRAHYTVIFAIGQLSCFFLSHSV